MVRFVSYPVPVHTKIDESGKKKEKLQPRIARSERGKRRGLPWTLRVPSPVHLTPSRPGTPPFPTKNIKGRNEGYLNRAPVPDWIWRPKYKTKTTITEPTRPKQSRPNIPEDHSDNSCCSQHVRTPRRGCTPRDQIVLVAWIPGTPDDRTSRAEQDRK